MSDYREMTIGKAAALAGSAGTAVATARAIQDAPPTFAGMSGDQWALVGYVLAATYTALLILMLLPRLFGFVVRYWHKLFPPKPDDGDQAGA